MIYSRITGTGGYLPEKVLSNKDLESLVDTTDEWIVERTGIRQRHVVEGQSACDLAEIAARRALEMAGKSPEDVDLIEVGAKAAGFEKVSVTIDNRWAQVKMKKK